LGNHVIQYSIYSFKIARLILGVSTALNNLRMFWIPHHLLQKLSMLAGNIHIGVLHLWVLLFSPKARANADGEGLVSLSSLKFSPPFSCSFPFTELSQRRGGMSYR
jgi:hypothetical protein